MKLLHELWTDEAGSIVSAELVLLGTLGVVGFTVGASAIGHSMEAELDELSLSLRSLDQSYQVRGFRGCGSWTAGSGYVQPPVDVAHAELRTFVEQEREIRQREVENRKQPQPAEKPDDTPTEHWDGDDRQPVPESDDAV